MSEIEELLLSEQDLVRNAANRLPVCICVDASLSMMDECRMAQANEGIRGFIESIKEDYAAVDSVEMCVISFGGDCAKIEVPFSVTHGIVFQDIRAHGQTPMGHAVMYAIDQIRERQALYSDYGITTYKPWLILISDGEATDDITAASSELLRMQEEGKLKVLCIGLGDKANSLEKFHFHGEVTQLQDFQLTHFFSWLSRSMSKLSMESPYEDLEIPDRCQLEKMRK